MNANADFLSDPRVTAVCRQWASERKAMQSFVAKRQPELLATYLADPKYMAQAMTEAVQTPRALQAYQANDPFEFLRLVRERVTVELQREAEDAAEIEFYEQQEALTPSDEEVPAGGMGAPVSQQESGE